MGRLGCVILGMIIKQFNALGLVGCVGFTVLRLAGVVMLRLLILSLPFMSFLFFQWHAVF